MLFASPNPVNRSSFVFSNRKEPPLNSAYTPLKMMLETTLHIQKEKANLISKLSPQNRLDEFCTVKFCTSRQSGHTFAGIRLSLEFFQHSVFLSPTDTQSKLMAKAAEHALQQIAGVEDISYEDFILNKKSSLILGDRHVSFKKHTCDYRSTFNFLKEPDPVNYNAIFVDGASSMTSSKFLGIKREAKAYLSSNKTFILCLLQ